MNKLLVAANAVAFATVVSHVYAQSPPAFMQNETATNSAPQPAQQTYAQYQQPAVQQQPIQQAQQAPAPTPLGYAQPTQYQQQQQANLQYQQQQQALANDQYQQQLAYAAQYQRQQQQLQQQQAYDQYQQQLYAAQQQAAQANQQPQTYAEYQKQALQQMYGQGNPNAQAYAQYQPAAGGAQAAAAPTAQPDAASQQPAAPAVEAVPVQQVVQTAPAPQDRPSSAPSAEWPSWYVGMSGGLSFMQSNDIGGAQTGIVDYNNGGFGTFAFGYIPNVSFQPLAGMRFEGELGYHHNNISSVLLGGAGPDPTPAAGALRSFSYMANTYYDFRNPSPVTPYLGAGLGGALINFSRSAGVGNTDSQKNVFAYQFMGGLSYTPSYLPMTEWNIGYRYFAEAVPNFASPAGTIKLDDSTIQNVEVGGKFHF